MNEKKDFFLENVRNFTHPQQGSKARVATDIFRMMNDRINDLVSPEQGRRIARECAALYNVSQLSLSEFAELFKAGSRLENWLINVSLFDRGRLYFSDFRNALTDERRNLLSPLLKLLGNDNSPSEASSNTESPAATTAAGTTSAVQSSTPNGLGASHSDRCIGVLLDRIVANHIKGEDTVDFTSRIARELLSSSLSLPIMFAPPEIQGWLESEIDVNKQIMQTVVLLEVIAWIIHWTGSHSSVSIVNAIPDRLIVLAGKRILDEIEEKNKRLKLSENTAPSLDGQEQTLLQSLSNAIVSQVKIFNCLPASLFPSILSGRHLERWKRDCNGNDLALMAFIYHCVDEERQEIFINTLAPAAHCKSNQVIKDYWLNRLAQFPLENYKTFLSKLPERSPQDNLRSFLGFIGSLKLEQLEQLLQDTRFKWSYVIESHVVYNLTASIMFARVMGIQVAVEKNCAIWESYVSYRASSLADNIITVGRSPTLRQTRPDVSERRAKLRQPFDAAQVNFNPGYWYDTDDITDVIQAEIGLRGLAPEGCPVRALPVVTIEDTEGFRITLTAGLRYITSTLPDNTVYTVLIPLNIGSNHWVGCILNIDRMNRKANFIYINSLEHQPESIINSMQALFVRVLGDRYQVAHSSILTDYPIWSQEDGCSCGPFLIANFMRYAYAQGLENSAPSATSLRLAHVNMMGVDFATKQFRAPTLAYQPPLIDRERAELELQRKGQDLYEKICNLSEGGRGVFYELCKNIEDNPDPTLFYQLIRASISDILEIERAINASNEAPISDNLLVTNVLKLFQAIFIDVNVDGGMNEIERLHTDALFAEDLTNILPMALRIYEGRVLSNATATATSTAEPTLAPRFFKPAYGHGTEASTVAPQALRSKAEDLHRSLNTLHRENKPNFYQFCKHLVEDCKMNLPYPELRDLMISLYENEVALNAMEPETSQLPEETIGLNMLNMLKEIFIDVKDDMGREAIFKHITDAHFVQNLPHIFRIVYEMAPLALEGQECSL
jgi:hypothetical protein